MKLSNLTLLLLLFVPVPVIGQDSQKSAQEKLLDIKLETSSVIPTAGAGLGVTATLTNKSKGKIYLSGKNSLLLMPPELVCDTCSVFLEASTISNDTTTVLNQGDTHAFYWDAFPPAKSTFLPRVFRQIRDEMDFVFFVPGEYKFKSLIRFWTQPNLDESSAHRAEQTLVLKVVAPESVLLFGAGLGGLLGHFLFRKRETANTLQGTSDSPKTSRLLATLRVIGEFASSMLLSIIVTLMLARLSETQFIIRVTVSDFWGAIVIGFLANYFGLTIIDQMTKSMQKAKSGATS